MKSEAEISPSFSSSVDLVTKFSISLFLFLWLQYDFLRSIRLFASPMEDLMEESFSERLI